MDAGTPAVACASTRVGASQAANATVKATKAQDEEAIDFIFQDKSALVWED